MNKKRKWAFISVLTAFFLLWAFPMGANAHEAPDFSRTASISFEMKYSGTAVGGGSMTLYRVGDIAEDDGNFSFSWIPALKQCGLDITQLQSPTVASQLAVKVKEGNLTGQEKTIDSDGKVTFENLELGLYLAVQEKAASGYTEAEPFLISAPVWEGDSYSYQVDASPKIELERKPTPTKPGQSQLPQTGQLNWPIPFLSILGLIFFALGWYLRFGKRKG